MTHKHTTSPRPSDYEPMLLDTRRHLPFNSPDWLFENDGYRSSRNSERARCRPERVHGGCEAATSWRTAYVQYGAASQRCRGVFAIPAGFLCFSVLVPLMS